MNNNQQLINDLLNIIEVSTQLLHHLQNYNYDIHSSVVNKTATILMQLNDITNDFEDLPF